MSIGILPNVNSINNVLFPHHKVDEQPNKKPKKGYNSHKRRESDDKNAVASVKIEPQLGCVSQDSEALVSQRGDLFVTVMLLEETPAVLSLGKLCEDHGYTYQWTSSQKPHLTN